MTSEEYSEKLKDVRWARKRERILRRDGYVCRECGDSRTILDVHHLYYIAGLEPWEYKDSDLITLCGACHETLHLRAKAKPSKSVAEVIEETVSTVYHAPWKGSWKKRAPKAEPTPGRENYFANLAAAMPDDVKLAFAELAGIMRLDTERKTIRRVG